VAALSGLRSGILARFSLIEFLRITGRLGCGPGTVLSTNAHLPATAAVYIPNAMRAIHTPAGTAESRVWERAGILIAITYWEVNFRVRNIVKVRHFDASCGDLAIFLGHPDMKVK